MDFDDGNEEQSIDQQKVDDLPTKVTEEADIEVSTENPIENVSVQETSAPEEQIPDKTVEITEPEDQQDTELDQLALEDSVTEQQTEEGFSVTTVKQTEKPVSVSVQETDEPLLVTVQETNEPVVVTVQETEQPELVSEEKAVEEEIIKEVLEAEQQPTEGPVQTEEKEVTERPTEPTPIERQELVLVTEAPAAELEVVTPKNEPVEVKPEVPVPEVPNGDLSDDSVEEVTTLSSITINVDQKEQKVETETTIEVSTEEPYLSLQKLFQDQFADQPATSESPKRRRKVTGSGFFDDLSDPVQPPADITIGNSLRVSDPNDVGRHSQNDLQLNTLNEDQILFDPFEETVDESWGQKEVKPEVPDHVDVQTSFTVGGEWIDQPEVSPEPVSDYEDEEDDEDEEEDEDEDDPDSEVEQVNPVSDDHEVSEVTTLPPNLSLDEFIIGGIEEALGLEVPVEMRMRFKDPSNGEDLTAGSSAVSATWIYILKTKH